MKLSRAVFVATILQSEGFWACLALIVHIGFPLMPFGHDRGDPRGRIKFEEGLIFYDFFWFEPILTHFDNFWPPCRGPPHDLVDMIGVFLGVKSNSKKSDLNLPRVHIERLSISQIPYGALQDPRGVKNGMRLHILDNFWVSWMTSGSSWMTSGPSRISSGSSLMTSGSSWMISGSVWVFLSSVLSMTWHGLTESKDRTTKACYSHAKITENEPLFEFDSTPRITPIMSKSHKGALYALWWLNRLRNPHFAKWPPQKLFWRASFWG